MATPPTAAGSTPHPPPPGRIFGKVRLIVLSVLLALLALCLISIWLTRGARSTLAFLRAQRGAARQTLVDLGPWQTAQTLASLAVTAEEHEYARQAEHLADHEVDQAFAAALRQADLQNRRRSLTGEARTLSQRVTQLQEEITQDRAALDQIKAQAGGKDAFGPEVLQVAQAQLDLDSDQLADAQIDFQRATGDRSVRIQQELATHQASMHDYDTRQKNNAAPVATVSVRSHGTLAGRLKAWFDQRSRVASIEQALAQAQNDVRTITAERNAIETALNAPTSGAGPLGLTQLQNSRTERQILAIDDDRIQTSQQLADVYDKWDDQVLLQHSLLLHLILRSLSVILAIVVAMILGDGLLRRLLGRPSLDHRQSQILRTIFEVGVQVLGVLLIALVLFGPPRQTATFFGLATAALTISLQDYVIAFLGWFMLVGKNGIRVGDIVEINGVSGEVVDIGLMSTTLLETGSIASHNQLTGRRVSFLNSFAIRGRYFNFSSRGQWLWDEMTITVPAGTDFYTLSAAIEKLARDETAESARIAQHEWNAGMRAPGLHPFSAAPLLMLRPSGSAIEIQLRYVTNAKERLDLRDRLYRKIIQLLEEKQLPATANESAVVTP